jgi:hypothetical protein
LTRKTATSNDVSEIPSPLVTTKVRKYHDVLKIACLTNFPFLRSRSESRKHDFDSAKIAVGTEPGIFKESNRRTWRTVGN